METNTAERVLCPVSEHPRLVSECGHGSGVAAGDRLPRSRSHGATGLSRDPASGADTWGVDSAS